MSDPLNPSPPVGQPGMASIPPQPSPAPPPSQATPVPPAIPPIGSPAPPVVAKGPSKPDLPEVSTELALASLGSILSGHGDQADKFFIQWYNAKGKKMLNDAEAAHKKAVAEFHAAKEQKLIDEAKAAGDKSIAEAAKRSPQNPAVTPSTAPRVGGQLGAAA